MFLKAFFFFQMSSQIILIDIMCEITSGIAVEIHTHTASLHTGKRVHHTAEEFQIWLQNGLMGL